MDITFHGAAGEVTGSCHLVQAGGRRVLLDCGMVQGGDDSDARNRAAFPFDPAEVDAVVLSHAHIDHSGRLPLLVKRGFKGPVYTHAATRDLCKIMLRDSAAIQQQDAERETRHRKRAGQAPVAPLYTEADAERVLGRVRTLCYGEVTEVAPGLTVRLSDAGHILGSAIVELWGDGADGRRKLVFSGDLGHRGNPVLPDPARVAEADLVVMESTYGDRNHRPWHETWDEIGDIFAAAKHEKGNILIPAFAVGRSQGLISAFQREFATWGLGDWRIFLDSPMAIRATQVYKGHLNLVDESVRTPAHGDGPYALPNLEFTESPELSRTLNAIHAGAVIIAGSGMCTGGRILHHLKHNLWRPEAHVMIVGFQPAGVPGRRLVDGTEHMDIWGDRIPVRARIHTVGGLSAHADQDGLARWYGGFAGTPPVALLHGEETARAALARRLQADHGVAPVQPTPGTRITL
ncbi:MBL fold metallo-hydrolase [Roseovarius salinarum]|uniref:MBL fold metallo-hydrolase n=1 Tax=Roseovarius salinarum TaxID=1981892 RepID=UPI000C3399D1|nr:MBL fold metallo-hydrolase [Roseovarius salinarum]